MCVLCSAAMCARCMQSLKGRWPSSHNPDEIKRELSAWQLKSRALAQLSIHTGWVLCFFLRVHWKKGLQIQRLGGRCQASYIRPACPACLYAFVGAEMLYFEIRAFFFVLVTSKKCKSTKPASLPGIFDSLYSSRRRWFPNNIFTVAAAAGLALFSLHDFSWLACAACFPQRWQTWL